MLQTDNVQKDKILAILQVAQSKSSLTILEEGGDPD